MDKEILNEWIKVLKTTNKRQGIASLKRKGNDPGSDEYYEYCCLGILCEDVFKLTSEYGGDSQEYFDGVPDYLPESVAIKLGLTSKNLRGTNTPGWSIYITLTKESYNRGMENSENFVSGIDKINSTDASNPDYETVSEKLENTYMVFRADELNDTYELSFKEIAAFLEYAQTVS